MQASEASAALAEIETMVARVKQSRVYLMSSGILILWGAAIALANLLAFAIPHWTPLIWIGVDALSVLATVVMIRRWRGGGLDERRLSLRMLGAFAVVFAFGFAVSLPLGHFGPRELDAFWPLLFLFLYALAGLWFGWVFTALGVGLSALILGGYFWSGVYFDLWLALVNGAGFLACGLWMRRACTALDELIHQPVRLKLMAALTALDEGDEGLDFVRLKKLTGATDGNLGAHIDQLSRAAYVEVAKAFAGRRPRTTVKATRAGRAAFAGHVAFLKSIISGG